MASNNASASTREGQLESWIWSESEEAAELPPYFLPVRGYPKRYRACHEDEIAIFAAIAARWARLPSCPPAKNHMQTQWLRHCTTPRTSQSATVRSGLVVRRPLSAACRSIAFTTRSIRRKQNIMVFWTTFQNSKRKTKSNAIASRTITGRKLLSCDLA